MRRVPTHPSGSRGYDESDYEFMKFIKYHFYKKLREATGTEEGRQNESFHSNQQRKGITLLKWAGKRWLADSYTDLFPKPLASITKYF